MSPTDGEREPRRIFRKRFLGIGVAWTGLLVVLVSLSEGHIFGNVESTVGLSLMWLYAAFLTSCCVALKTRPSFRQWALEPPHELGKADGLVSNGVLGGAGVMAFLSYELIRRLAS